MKPSLHLKFPFVLAVVLSVRLVASGENRAPATERATPIEWQSKIGDGIAPFVPQGYKPGKTPSFALAAPPREQGEVAAGWKLVPGFFQENGRAGASLAIPEEASLYGTGEVTGPLLRNGKWIVIWNTDCYAYGDLKSLRLYQSHPWVLWARPDGTAFGVLFETTWRSAPVRGKLFSRARVRPFASWSSTANCPRRSFAGSRS